MHVHLYVHMLEVAKQQVHTSVSCILGLRMRIMPRAKECQSGSSTHRLRSISDSSLFSGGPRPGTALSLTSTPPSSTLMTVGDVTNAKGNRHAHYVRARMRAKVLIDIPEA